MYLRAEGPTTTGQRLGALAGRLAGPVLGVLALALVPHLSFTEGDTFFWMEIMISIMYATAANMLIGYTGLVSFGQASFLGAGAYTVGMMITKGGYESMFVNIVLGTTIAAALAFVVGALIVRTTGLAFAILTLAFLQLFSTMAFSEDTFGGENGLSGVVRGNLGPIDLKPLNNYYYFVLVLLVLAMAAMWLIVSSPFGLTLRSIREDAQRTEFLGVQARLYKLGVFTLAGLFSGLAGALTAYQTLFTSAEIFSIERSAEPVLMSILGGTGFFFGPTVGAVVYEWLRHWLQARTAAWVLWVGLGLVIIIVALRRGIMGLFHQLWDEATKRVRRSGQGAEA